jgi:rubrerythrin
LPVTPGGMARETFGLVGPASACQPEDGGALTPAECLALCVTTGACAVADNGGGYVTCIYSCPVTGRRPEGLASKPIEGPDAAARFLAQSAYLEAASVDAFERLAQELQAHGAPTHLIAASKRAAKDEVRHARVTTKLAEGAGAEVPTCRVAPRSVRSLEEMAIENAVEGCVRETFGAAVGIIQAERASDRRVRRAMKRIARDETRHAELSWAVARWLEHQLDADARRRVREAQEKAVAALTREAAHEPDASLTERLGVPTASQARAVLAELQANLWSKPMAA